VSQKNSPKPQEQQPVSSEGYLQQGYNIGATAVGYLTNWWK
jgi:hypothetical protein